MKKVIIGHRGVGKTAFLKRHERYLNNADCVHLDLDNEIEKKYKAKISDIFKTQGESEFRKIESEVFFEIIRSNQNFILSLGAGFQLSVIPDDIEVLFISRITDQAGRIFLNRPRLEVGLSAIEESQKRYLIRQPKYLEAADSIYFMPEGIENENSLEQAIFCNQSLIQDAFYTLVEKEIPYIQQIKNKFKKIELRTDLININKIEELVQNDKDYHWLISIRNQLDIKLIPGIQYDFDLSIENIPNDFFNHSDNVISCHEEDLQKAIQMTEHIHNNHIKLSPIIESFDELQQGYLWQQQDSENRSFLPRSANGKWLWFRQLSKYFQKINFIRSFTFIYDQPSEFQWLSLPQQKPDFFAAVIGQPVLFSRSPLIHHQFFQNHKTFFTAIEISANEFNQFSNWLNFLGLRFAAVTSPIKEAAFQISTQRSSLSTEFKSANTLAYANSDIVCENTDWFGFKKLVQQVHALKKKICVWGGGGTLNMMKSVLPSAHYFSSRSGTLRDISESAEVIDKSVLVWAAPRLKETQFPDSKLRPDLVIDLNYVENSMGLEYAEKENLNYKSGIEMFSEQAKQQQIFWSQYL